MLNREPLAKIPRTRGAENANRGCHHLFKLHKISSGTFLQRLFSTFPSSWPGFGLLLLRACLGSALLYFAINAAGKPQDSVTLAPYLIAAAGGIFLLAGLWTPVMGTLVAFDEAWIALRSPIREDRWLCIFLAVLSISVAMLGPGAWSIDARLFGRTRIDLDRSIGRRPPPLK